MGSMIRTAFLIFLVLVILGYFVERIEVAPTELPTIRADMLNLPPDSNRAVLDYDWNHCMYIYYDMLDTFTEYGGSWYHKDSLPNDYYRTKRNDNPKPTKMEAGDYELENNDHGRR